MFAQTFHSLSRVLLAGIVASACLQPVAQARPAGDGQVQQGVSETVAQWRSAVEAGNLPALGRLYGPNSIVYAPDAFQLKGREAIAAAYAGMFDKYTAQVEIKDARYLRAGPLLHSWGLYVLTLTPKAGGEALRMEGRFSDLAQREAGQWRYIVDHASLPVR